jgi:hypothetical protein
MKYKLLCVALFFCWTLRGQQTSQLTCRGVMGDVQATLTGVRQFAATNVMGDGYVKFVGKVTAGGIAGRMTYEGYTRTAPFSGVITSPQNALRISVLDNTGGQMIIYGGTPTLGPPQIIGRFVCRWN